MSQILYMFLAALNNFLFTKMNHPMNMGIILLLQTLLMCLVTGCMSQTAWFSYILFLVFLGGMLILFIYMTSIASNEIFQKSNYLLLYMLFSTISFIILLFILFMDPVMTSFNSTGETLSFMSIILIVITTVIMSISSFISKKSVIDREKMSPFECGFDPFTTAGIPFSLRFFLIAVIFLIFNVEIALLLKNNNSNMSLSNIKTWMWISSIFFIILLLGLYHEWNCTIVSCGVCVAVSLPNSL